MPRSRSHDDAWLICVDCGEPVVERPQDYELFDRMHWRCFHFHYGDPAERCNDPSCPVAADGGVAER